MAANSASKCQHSARYSLGQLIIHGHFPPALSPPNPTEQALPVFSPPPSHVTSFRPHKGHSRAQGSSGLMVGLGSSGIYLSPPLGRERFASHSALSPGSQTSPPPTSAAIIFQLSDSTLRPSPRPWLGNFTACYNFAFVIRSAGQTSKAPFSLLPLSRFYNHLHQCNLHYLNLEPPDFYLGRQDTPAS